MTSGRMDKERMSDAFGSDSFDAMDYLEYLRRRWKVVVTTLASAAAVAALGCILLPKQYTAAATLVIEPPGGDPRTAAAVSPIYLESLKSYEALASSDSLFAKACAKFHLLDGGSASSLEAFKRRVLRVNKLKDTKLLEISVTLPDPKEAQALVQYLAEQTVSLNHDLAQTGDHEMMDQVTQQFEAAQKQMDGARAESAALASAGSELVLQSEAQALADLQSRTEEQTVDANAALAESVARGDQESAAAERAKLSSLTADAQRIGKELKTKSSGLAALEAQTDRADDRLRIAGLNLEAARKRLDDMRAAIRFRTEQLRIVDPGIIPQRPSFPNFPLAIAAAIAFGGVACLTWLTLQFGFARRREMPSRAGLRVAGGSSR